MILEHEKKRWYKNKLIILLGFLLPLIISLIVLYLIFGDLWNAFEEMVKLKGKPSRTADAVASLSYIGTLLIAFYGLITTALFSYLVWRVSVGSFRVSEGLKTLEENRDKEIIREHALIVYYDLQRGFSYLRHLYISVVLQEKIPKIKRLFFSEEWIKNVATLRNELLNEDLNKVYEMYNQFFTLQSLLENYAEGDTAKKELLQFIKETANEIFDEFIPFQLLDKFSTIPADDLIKIDLYITLQKIYKVTFLSTQIETKTQSNGSHNILLNEVSFYCGKSGDIFSGEGILYTSNGYPKANGYFEDGVFMTGKVYGYSESNSKCYEIEYATNSSKRAILRKQLRDLERKDGHEFYYKGDIVGGEILNGITTIFKTKNPYITYRGQVVDGMKHGEGVIYNKDGTIHFKGKYKKGERVEGSLYKKGREIFSGEFNNIYPWNGQIIKFDFPNEKIKGFTGEIREGKPYNGTGLRFKRNEYGENLEDLYEDQRDWEPDLEQIEEWEQQEEERYALQNEYTRQQYYNWEDYIKTDWQDGEDKEREDVEKNTVVYYNPSNIK